MSLETNLQLNNELVAKNNELLNRLIQSLSAGVALHADTVAEVQSYAEKPKANSHQKEERKGPFWWKSLDGLKTGVVDDTTALKAIIDANAGIEITKVEYLQLQETPTDSTPKIEDLTRSEVLLLAVLFGENAQDLTDVKVGEVRRRLKKPTDPCTKQAVHIAGAIDATGSGKNIGNARLLAISQQMSINYGSIHSDDLLKSYARALVDSRVFDLSTVEIPAPEATPEPETAGGEQDTAALFEQARTLVMKLTTGGYRNEAVEILNKFGAQKLGQVPQENLADVVMLAEAALQGE